MINSAPIRARVTTSVFTITTRPTPKAVSKSNE